ncbi:hypothetical protein LINPERPRIM_LOCUS23470 [Linum perenne]
MLLIITMTVTVSQETGCSSDGPVPFGACKDDYAYCVTAVITEMTPNTNSNPKLLYTSWPHGQPSGSVKGYAICALGSSAAQCKSCLEDAKEWLANNCGDYDSGVYSQPGCGVSYVQVP